jgi:hypothetical protein
MENFPLFLSRSNSLRRCSGRSSSHPSTDRCANSVGPKVSTSVDLPLSDACKRILEYGMEEAEPLNHRHTGWDHLFPASFARKHVSPQNCSNHSM